MKLAIETYAIREKVGDEQAIRLFKAAGFDGIDYSFYYTPDDSPITGAGYLEHAKAVRACGKDIVRLRQRGQFVAALQRDRQLCFAIPKGVDPSDNIPDIGQPLAQQKEKQKHKKSHRNQQAQVEYAAVQPNHLFFGQ